MNDFKRSLSDDLIAKLQNEKLYTDKLLPDIREGAVLPAVRKDKISFYYKGGRLFTYNKSGFETHIKYCVIPESNSDYIKEPDLKGITIATSFYDQYKEIKTRCELYSGGEANAVSALYKGSCLSDSRVIFLDTEIALYTNSDKDRIDILLYDKESRKLCFCEAKLFSNPEIWAHENQKPKVCKQIDKYDKKIDTHYDDILAQYTNYISILNKLFGTDLPAPTSLHNKTGLLIFGFDSFQREKIKKLLIDDGSLDGISYYPTGKLKSDQICTLFDNITKA